MHRTPWNASLPDGRNSTKRLPLHRSSNWCFHSTRSTDTLPITRRWARVEKRHAPPLLMEWLVVDADNTSARHAATRLLRE